MVLYTLTVTGGSGSGSFTNGAVVNIVASNAPAGQVFDRWVVSAGNPVTASLGAASTTLTMPATDVTVTATYNSIPPPTVTVGMAGGNMSLGVSTVLGATYVLESATALWPPPINWIPVATNVGDGQVLSITIIPDPQTPRALLPLLGSLIHACPPAFSALAMRPLRCFRLDALAFEAGVTYLSNLQHLSGLSILGCAILAHFEVYGIGGYLLAYHWLPCRVSFLIPECAILAHLCHTCHTSQSQFT